MGRFSACRSSLISQRMQANCGSVDLHRVWIETLLREYYGPMCAFQREKNLRALSLPVTKSK